MFSAQESFGPGELHRSDIALEIEKRARRSPAEKLRRIQKALAPAFGRPCAFPLDQALKSE
jgi:hypothetical protein